MLEFFTEAELTLQAAYLFIPLAGAYVVYRIIKQRAKRTGTLTGAGSTRVDTKPD